jgi:hypothetical protein
VVILTLIQWTGTLIQWTGTLIQWTGTLIQWTGTLSHGLGPMADARWLLNSFVEFLIIYLPART